MRAITLFSFLLLITLQAVSQNQIYLKINHKLGSESFGYKKEVKNNLNESFQLTRLQYYISGIKIYHDNEINTYYPNKFMLITANGTFSKELIGDLDFETIEAIEFLIGVKTPENNDDPTAWETNHPLSPKEPSMHWGWSAGYRFVAMEGKSGPNLDKLFEIHGLGNDNLIAAKINVTPKDENGEKVIELDADYTKIIESITIKDGVVFHGGAGIAARALKNFRQFVFTNNFTSSTKTLWNDLISVSPNPSNGIINIALPSDSSIDKIEIINVDGKILETILNITDRMITTDLRQTGLYYLRFYSENIIVGNKSIAVMK